MDELINEVGQELGCSFAHARLVCDAVFAALTRRSRTQLRGFGSFSRSPRGVLVFKASSRLGRVTESE